MKISDSVAYVGVNDFGIDLFEGQFQVPNGMSYNSYLILDEKICIIDSVDANFGDEWISNIQQTLATSLNAKDRTPDYLVVLHMEMDHSSNIKKFTEQFPKAKIVSSKMAFNMMKNMFEDDFTDNQIVVTEGETLNLGTHTLQFMSAPHVHWPEVLIAYEEKEQILFSADAFGTFGALPLSNLENWEEEARRYYFGIVGKFGTAVATVLKKISTHDIKTICSLHGPIINNNITHYINLYNRWANYDVETQGVVIAYTSVYGHTKTAVKKLGEILTAKGCPHVTILDLAREDIYKCVAETFRYGKIVFASTTYNGGVFPAMREFIQHLVERNFQKRTIALIENGSWAPLATKTMFALLEPCSNLTYTSTKVSIKISMKEADVAALENLADELLKS